MSSEAKHPETCQACGARREQGGAFRDWEYAHDKGKAAASAEVEALKAQVSKLEGKLKATGYLATASIKDFKMVAEALGFKWDEMTEPPDVHEFVEKHVAKVEALRALVRNAYLDGFYTGRMDGMQEMPPRGNEWWERSRSKGDLEALQPAQGEEAGA